MLVSLISIVVFAYFFLEFINKRNPNIYSFTDVSDAQVVRLTNRQMGLALGLYIDSVNQEEGLFSLAAELVSSTASVFGQSNNEIRQSIDLERCDMRRHFQFVGPQDWFSQSSLT